MKTYEMTQTLTVVTPQGEFTNEPTRSVVDQEWLDNCTDKDTLKWFRSLGGKEKVTRRAGGIVICLSTSPDGQHITKRVFIPIAE